MNAYMLRGPHDFTSPFTTVADDVLLENAPIVDSVAESTLAAFDLRSLIQT